MGEFDVIIGMDWLHSNHAEIVCNKKLIRIRNEDGKEMVIYGSRRKNQIGLISAIKAKRCRQKGCSTYLAYVIDAKAEKKVVENVPIVDEFPDVFPDELPGVPQERQVEFKIELVPGAALIAKTLYRLAPSEMQELMNQL